VPVPTTLWEDLLGLLVTGQPETFFVHREDLTGETDITDNLTNGFGAEQGDAIVEVGLSVGMSTARVRRWEVPAAVSDSGPKR
jgi:hypothetical protein